MAHSPAIIKIVAILLISSLNNLVNSQHVEPDTKSSSFGCLLTGNASITYQNNVNLLLNGFVFQSSQKGYYYTSIGDNPDKVFGYYMCRGDLTPQECHSFIVNATELAHFGTNCEHVDGIFYSEECIFRYSNHSMYGIWQQKFNFVYEPIGMNVSNNQQYNKTLSSTIETVINEAAFGSNNSGSVIGFATKEVRVEGDKMIYSLAQCTPDIVGVNCSRCLRDAFFQLRSDFGEYQGGEVIMPNCLLEFKNQPFYYLNRSTNDGFRQPNLVVVYSAFSLFLYYMLTFW